MVRVMGSDYKNIACLLQVAASCINVEVLFHTRTQLKSLLRQIHLPIMFGFDVLFVSLV